MTARKNGPSAAAVLRVMKRDRFRCTYCGASGNDSELQVDHITPVAKGGSHHLANLTTACRNCNQSKGSRIWPSPSSSGKTDDRRDIIGMWVLIGVNDDPFEVGEIVGIQRGHALVDVAWGWGSLQLSNDIRHFRIGFILSEECALFRNKQACQEELRRRVRLAREQLDSVRRQLGR